MSKNWNGNDLEIKCASCRMSTRMQSLSVTLWPLRCRPVVSAGGRWRSGRWSSYSVWMGRGRGWLAPRAAWAPRILVGRRLVPPFRGYTWSEVWPWVRFTSGVKHVRWFCCVPGFGGYFWVSSRLHPWWKVFLQNSPNVLSVFFGRQKVVTDRGLNLAQLFKEFILSGYYLLVFH